MKKVSKRVSAVLVAMLMVFSMIPLSVIAIGEHEHIDIIENGYCDECNIALESLVTLYAKEAVTRTLKAGTPIKEAMNDILTSQGVEAAALFYKDGSKVGDTDVVPYGYEIMEIYPLIYYRAEIANCRDYGHKAYYYNTLNDLYYEDEACTKLIGFDDEDGLTAWFFLIGKGATQESEEHECVPCEDVSQGHLCSFKDCKYHETPDMHSLSDDFTCCEDCGARCYVGCPHDPTDSDFYAFTNTFVNDGEPLKYVWYYVGEDVTLTEPLIIAGREVRLLIADGVTFDAQAGYYCLPGCTFDVYYQSKTEGKGTFIGTELLCRDDSTGVFYDSHVVGENLVCEVCGKSTCKHKNIEHTYEWSEDYSSCHGKAYCNDCKTVLYDCDGEVESYQVKRGNCVTKANYKYMAAFERGFTEKTVETEYGAHNINANHYCVNCLKDDFAGKKIYYSKMLDVLYDISDDESVRLKLTQIRTQLNNAVSQSIFEDILFDNSDVFEPDMDISGFVNYKMTINNEIVSFARRREYSSSAYKCALKKMPMIEKAVNMNELEKIGIEIEKDVVSLDNLKAEYLEKAFGEYLSDSNPYTELEMVQIYYGIIYAVDEEEVINAYKSSTLDSVKKAAKDVIDEAAGENQSADMQKLVRETKAAIEEATTKDAVKAEKQKGLTAIQNQLIKEAEEAKALAKAKLDAKKAIDGAAGADPSQTVSALAEAAKKLIDGANTVGEVNEAKEEWTAVIEKAISDEKAALTEAKTAAKTEIKKAADGVFDDTTSYEQEIEALDSITDVIEKLAEILGEINSEKTAKAVTSALEKLNEVSSNAVADKSAEIAKEAEQLIENAESVDEVNAVLAEALKKIANEEKTLSEAKTEVKNEVREAAGEKQSEEMKAVLNEAEKKIDGAKSVEEVENAKKEGLAAVEAQKEAEKPVEPVQPGEKETCPKCGGTHADNFFGKIVCFFNRIANFFRNLFK